MLRDPGAATVIVGVLGGMGPAATGQFLLELTRATPATTDQDHLHSIIDCDPSVPDRTSAILAGDDAPLVPIRSGLERLVDWGADLLAVPCNTAHIFIDSFRYELPVPLVHIVEATLAAARTSGPSGAWIAATDGTIATGLYQRVADMDGYRTRTPPVEIQDRVMRVVGLVKSGRTDLAGELFDRVVAELRDLEDLPVVMACTELPLAWERSSVPAARVVSSLTALAEGTVAAAGRVPVAGHGALICE